MSTWLTRMAGAGIATAATVAAAGALVERRIVRTRKAAAPDADRYRSLRSDPLVVTTADGVRLHAELDEVAPYAVQGDDHGAPGPDQPTVVFVHGYALNLDCWYFQRAALRGRRRMLFFDQRSHGRSGRSDRDHATIDQLGDDLATVLDQLVPEGPVVLVGHSMGGMAIVAFAESHPEQFASRVAGVALIATTAGGLTPSRTLSPLIPDRLGRLLAPRLMAALASAPELVDSARRRGSNIGYLVAERFAFGGDVPDAQVEFLDGMLAETPFEVLAEFFPGFATLDKFRVLGSFAMPTTIICGTRDVLTPVTLSRKMAALIAGSRLIEVPDAGHMVIFEAPDLIDTAIEQLIPGPIHPTGSTGADR